MVKVIPQGTQSGFAFQSKAGKKDRNFEVVVPDTRGGLRHYWRNGDSPDIPWRRSDIRDSQFDLSGDVNIYIEVCFWETDRKPPKHDLGDYMVIARRRDGVMHRYVRSNDLWLGPYFNVDFDPAQGDPALEKLGVPHEQFTDKVPTSRSFGCVLSQSAGYFNGSDIGKGAQFTSKFLLNKMVALRPDGKGFDLYFSTIIFDELWYAAVLWSSWHDWGPYFDAAPIATDWPEEPIDSVSLSVVASTERDLKYDPRYENVLVISAVTERGNLVLFDTINNPASAWTVTKFNDLPHIRVEASFVGKPCFIATDYNYNHGEWPWSGNDSHGDYFVYACVRNGGIVEIRKRNHFSSASKNDQSNMSLGLNWAIDARIGEAVYSQLSAFQSVYGREHGNIELFATKPDRDGFDCFWRDASSGVWSGPLTVE